jgi:hypothetical protein
MPMQAKNADLVSFMATYFAELDDPGFVYPRLAGAALGLPQLRAYWPFTSVDENGNVYDVSGQGRTLTNNNTATFGTSDLRVYGTTNGTDEDFSRADEAGLEFAGAMTALGWWYFSRASGTEESLMSKAGPLGASGWYFNRGTTDALTWRINNVSNSTANNLVSQNNWHHCAMRFTPSTEVAIFINGVKTAFTSSIPASITGNALAFSVNSALATGTARYLQGNVCQIALCGAAVSDVLIWSHFQQTRGLFGV